MRNAGVLAPASAFASPVVEVDDMPHSTSQRLQLRDGRAKGWFWADNDLFDRFDGLGTPAKIVYLALCRYAGSADVCYPAHREIARACDLGVATVKRAIERLVAAGLVRVEHRQASGRKTTNLYVLLSLPMAHGELSTDRPEPADSPERAVGQLTAGHKEEQGKNNTEEEGPSPAFKGMPAEEFVARMDRSGWKP